MARADLDPEVLAAIRVHVGADHGRAVGVGEIAVERRGRVAQATVVTFVPETEASPAWFICRLCPEGGRRYRVDLFAHRTRPPRRHVEEIRRHFAEAHGIGRLSRRRIYSQPSSAELALVTYGRSTPLSGAHIICHLCPVGVNRILIEEPPYGDARSFGELLFRRGELHGEVAGLGPVERAERLEAEHRGVVVPAVTQAAVRAALREARGGGERREPGELAEAIRAVLLRGVRQGTRITHAVAELARLMQEDPSGYAFRLAGAMPDMEAVLKLPQEQVAAMMVKFYGPLDRDERTLWRMWREIPRATLAEARTQGEAARR